MKVLFFAQCADWMGARELDVSLERPARLLELIERTPRLHPLLERMHLLRVAVNHELSDPGTVVGDEDVVAFLPPLSGG